MSLAQGRYWSASLSKDKTFVALETLKGSLPEELGDVRELRIEVPILKWGLVVKNTFSDRKLFGGLLLDYAKQKDRLSAVVGSERLLAELRDIVLRTTASLVEEEVVVIAPAEGSGD